jgi:poly [ADP-ribose] polymerase
MATRKTTDPSTPKKTVVRTMKNAKDDPFYDSPYSVVERVSMNFFDPEDNSNKYYIAELHSSTSGMGYRFYANHGRVGTAGAPKAEEFYTLSDARHKYESKVREKLRKGYNQVDLATVTAGSNEGQKKINEEGLKGIVDTSTISNKSSNLSAKITDFLKHIYEEANQAVALSLTGSVKTDIKAPLGNLGINGINAGRQLLAEIAKALKIGNGQYVRNGSIEFYRNIPRKMPSNIRDESTWILNTNDRISKEMDILDLYEDSLRLLPIMGLSDIDSKYLALNTDIAYVTDPKTLTYISDKISKSHARNHDFKLRVTNAFEVNMKNAPAFNNSCGNVVNLFHGSRSANLVGILSSYLKLPNKLGSEVTTTGAMFGQGLYFADSCTKSANYAFASFGGRRNKYDTAFLMITEVALGNVYEASEGNSYKSAPSGYHSVMGRKGVTRSYSGLLANNEFIVYRADQARVRYLIEVEKH